MKPSVGEGGGIHESKLKPSGGEGGRTHGSKLKPSGREGSGTRRGKLKPSGGERRGTRRGKLKPSEGLFQLKYRHHSVCIHIRLANFIVVISKNAFLCNLPNLPYLKQIVSH